MSPTIKLSKSMKKYILAVLVLSLAGCNNNRGGYDATGCFEATEITVSSEGTGRILSLDIEQGNDLVAGQVVGSIDSMQLYLSKLQLESTARSIESNRPDIGKQVAALRKQIAQQKSEQQRIGRLLKDGAATTKQLDDITTLIAVLESNLAASLSTLQNSTSGIDAQGAAVAIQIAQVDDRLSKCRITSPADGTVIEKYAETGETAVTGKPLFKIADIRHLTLRAYLTSGQLSRVNIGDTLNVTADFGGDATRPYVGRVVWISPKGEFTPKSIQTREDRQNTVYAVKIAVDNDGYIKTGMYGEVKFD